MLYYNQFGNRAVHKVFPYMLRERFSILLPPLLPVSAVIHGHEQSLAGCGQDFAAVEGQVLKTPIAGTFGIAYTPVSAAIGRILDLDRIPGRNPQ
jgi:hypothetical protein